MKRLNLLLLSNLKHSKKTMSGYGASTKGNVILQFCNLKKDLIKYICDVNKDKKNCYTPGTKIKIIVFCKEIRTRLLFCFTMYLKNLLV